MHILMVTNNYSPYSGGVVSSINATVDALQKQGHQVTLVTLDFLGEMHNDPVWVKRLICPIKFLYKKNHMAIAWRAKKQLKNIIAQTFPDVVHVHHPFFLGRIAACIAKPLNIPVVFTYHTIYEAYAHYVCLPQVIIRCLITRQVLSFCRYVDGIIAPSSTIKNYLSVQNIQTPIEVIPSAVQGMFISLQLLQRPIQQGQIRLLVVGRMVKEKNMHALVRVARQLADQAVFFTLTLVGYGQEYEPLVTYAYQELGLSHEQVIFIHKPEKEILLRLYRESDLFLFSSYTDTQGLVLAEAMSAGLPVIAFDGPGQRDIIVQDENGYIVADENEMVEKIKYLSKNNEQLDLLSKNAFKTAQLYQSHTLIKYMIDFYDHVRAGKK